MSEAELRQEIEQLRTELGVAEAFANGMQLMLVQILPHLLRDHPNVLKVQNSLRFSDTRYEELLAHPDRAEEDETAEQYEAGKMMYRQLALLGIWPDVDPDEALRHSLAR